MQASNTERKVSLFRNGRNQAIRIPKEYELEGSEAVIRRVGNTLVIEPVTKPTLLELLASLAPMEESVPEIDDLPLDDIDL
ncbi:antitoxin [Leucothrix pacifica]|uniref:AbrB/MazE/SpoVT family DNA-binding domain-containing protein n=1 Tax=Leucothrix pacifica TaxID=1247513 RepID=A0A317CHX7_9GAMM|nr:AbrB/MazE/SpoVT family DNA-binding domain-containing protein [Leucothrix pacifica]PWQ98158.1 AbrB/MazE/SpoVT family DNA-binding domain-containing protein [Leucothrix pacifica]